MQYRLRSMATMDLSTLLEGFGSVQTTREALDTFRLRCREAGLPGLHLNLIVWGEPVLPGEGTRTDHATLVQQLGFDSVTSYVWAHHVPLPKIQTEGSYLEPDRVHGMQYLEAVKRVFVE